MSPLSWSAESTFAHVHYADMSTTGHVLNGAACTAASMAFRDGGGNGGGVEPDWHRRLIDLALWFRRFCICSAIADARS